MKTQQTQPVKTRKQIADEFQINERTLRRWLKDAKLDLPQRMLTPNEQLMIYERFGSPGNFVRSYQKNA